MSRWRNAWSWIWPYFLAIGGAYAAATVPQIWTLNAVPGEELRNSAVVFDAPLTATRDAKGVMHVGLKFEFPPSVDCRTQMCVAPTDSGLQLASSVGSAGLLSIDTAHVLHLVPAPAGPGPCDGTGDVAIDDALYVYRCAATAEGVKWVRSKEPMVTTW